MAQHVSEVVSGSMQNIYALKTLKSHGLSGSSLSDICRATLVAKLSYAAPAWHGFLSSGEQGRLESTIKKATRWGIYSPDAPCIEAIIDQADQRLFKSILQNKLHVLHHLLPPVKTRAYNLRPRAYDRVLINKTGQLGRNFLQRMLYKDIF